MDSNQFDNLTKTLAGGASRRGVLRGALGALGGVLRLFGGAAAAPNACAQACAFEPKGPRLAACKQACKQCGGSLQDVCFDQQIICCPGSFGGCCFDDETGSISCPGTQQCPAPLVPDEGCGCVCPNTCPPGEFPDPGQDCACVPFPTCDAGGAPENCEAGVETSCADGVCACVTSVDGGTVCVERFCTFEACTTGTDCQFGPCVDIPGCCGEPTPFCGVPCGSAGAGTRSAGWGQ